MVGIPGKSKGCHTCRRRKIRCDLAQPSCERCTKSNRICEGYAKGSVFLNRTAEGLMKRKRLEETIPIRDAPIAESSRAATPIEHLIDPRLPAQVGAIAVCDVRLEGAFLERHLSSEGSREWGGPVAYLKEIMVSANRGRALEPALRALWMTRMARMTGNQDLLVRGRQHYGVSLRQLQRCLSHQELAMGEETLVTAQILSMYELYESTGGSVGAHDSHVAGLVRILQWRGRASLRSKLSQLILQIVRWNAMISGIQYRRRCPLGDVEWRTTSWNVIEDHEQSLYDIGFDVGALLEDLTIFHKSLSNQRASEPPSSPNIVGLTQRMVEINSLLDVWWDRFELWAPKPLYWENSTVFVSEESAFFDASSSPGRIFPEPSLSFPDIRLAHLTMDFWAVRLTLCIIMTCTLYAMPEHVKTLPAVQPFVACASQHSGNFMLATCNKLISAMPYTRRPEMGHAGAQKTLFSVRVALGALRTIPGPGPAEKARDLATVLRKMGVDYGLKFAVDLESNAGDWD